MIILMIKIISFLLLQLTLCNSLYLGWYGYDLNNMVGWTNIAHSNNISLLIENSNNGINQLFEITELYTNNFDGLILKSSWKNMINDNIKLFNNLFYNKTIFGFFMGDELMWNGLPYSNLTSASNYLRKIYPDSFIWENEAAYALKCNETYSRCFDKNNNTIKITNGIPPGLTAISTDIYHMTPDSNFVSYVKDFYNKWIYPKLHNNQKVFTVPGSFASNYNSKCDYDCYDTMCAWDALQYYNWALEDDLVIGINPWNWFNCSGCIKYKDEIGTSYMDITKKIWKTIGELILNKERSS